MADASAAPRGKLKIFFGAFPGAGKTDAMLDAARRMRESGRDVVIGVLDMHGKPEEAEATRDFETVGASAHGELDLDGVLRRRPQVALIDNLAHANPAGSRHPKRWSDVEELLGSGIDVYTTMSVQHLASLNDVVAEITGIPEPDTVPDTFFDTADETVMVDMSADELLVRVKSGQVPIEHVVQGPKKHFFQKGSLLALREIALRRVADVVEDEVRRYRTEKRIEATWKTHGRLLCCIGPEPGAEHVVRSAARLAGQLDERWTAVYVETPQLQRLPAPERARILQVVSLAGEMGADTAILTGNDVVDAVVEYASDQNISTVVMGPRHAAAHPLRPHHERCHRHGERALRRDRDRPRRLRRRHGGHRAYLQGAGRYRPAAGREAHALPVDAPRLRVHHARPRAARARLRPRQRRDALHAHGAARRRAVGTGGRPSWPRSST
jgi:two-component system sensor histidine kinase KdpD